jgi:hypothetical protein
MQRENKIILTNIIYEHTRAKIHDSNFNAECDKMQYMHAYNMWHILKLSMVPTMAYVSVDKRTK